MHVFVCVPEEGDVLCKLPQINHFPFSSLNNSVQIVALLIMKQITDERYHLNFLSLGALLY